jgi:hypothetical protein
MLEAASFSLCSLLVFRPRVRGGDGTPDVSTESLAVRPAEAEDDGSGARDSFAATGPGGVEFGRLPYAEGSSFFVVASRSGASSSFSASKMFLFSRVASAEGVAFGAWGSESFCLGCLRRFIGWNSSSLADPFSSGTLG